MSQRPETGPMVFGDDWPGVFIRGDNAWAYTNALKEALAALDGTAMNEYFFAELNGLADLLSSCNVTSNKYNHDETQVMHNYETCVTKQ